MEQNGLDPRKYLRFERVGLNGSFYQQDAQKQLLRDFKRANNPAFEERYLKGYEFFPVPAFRGARAKADGAYCIFLVSLGKSIADGIGRAATINKLVRSIKKAFDRVGIKAGELDGESLCQALDEHWPDIGPAVRAFYLTGQRQLTLK